MVEELTAAWQQSFEDLTFAHQRSDEDLTAYSLRSQGVDAEQCLVEDLSTLGR